MKWPWQQHKNSKNLTAVIEKLDHLLDMWTQLNDGTGSHRVHITVEHLQVEKASLEQLIFRLGQLDIKELSGTLSIGNNFGTPTSPQGGEVEQFPSAFPDVSHLNGQNSKGQTENSEHSHADLERATVQNTDRGLRLRWDVD